MARGQILPLRTRRSKYLSVAKPRPSAVDLQPPSVDIFAASPVDNSLVIFGGCKLLWIPTPHYCRQGRGCSLLPAVQLCGEDVARSLHIRPL